jgi:Ca-activated chloride channel family protein
MCPWNWPGSRWLAAVLAGILPSSLAAQAAIPLTSEPPRQSVKVNVDLVLVPTTVADPFGRMVSGLGLGHFRIFEDGVEQEVLKVHEEDAPISVAIVFDVSGSMRPLVDIAREAALEFLRSAGPDDRFTMVAFASRAEVVTDVNTTEDELRMRLLSTSAKGLTAMLDGMYLGLAKLRTAPTQRRVMLVITDGMDNHSRYSFKDVDRALKEADVQVYGLGYDGGGLLRRFVESTGGRMFGLSASRSTSAMIWTELRNQYVLSYRSSNRRADGKWRKIKIRLRTPKGMPPLQIYAKSGYYAPKR